MQRLNFESFLSNCPWIAANSYDWIYMTPAIIVLFVNVLFLVRIMWVSAIPSSISPSVLPGLRLAVRNSGRVMNRLATGFLPMKVAVKATGRENAERGTVSLMYRFHRTKKSCVTPKKEAKKELYPVRSSKLSSSKSEVDAVKLGRTLFHRVVKARKSRSR